MFLNINKPEAKYQSKAQAILKFKKMRKEFGWVVTEISWATIPPPPPPTFKRSEWDRSPKESHIKVDSEGKNRG